MNSQIPHILPIFANLVFGYSLKVEQPLGKDVEDCLKNITSDNKVWTVAFLRGKNASDLDSIANRLQMPRIYIIATEINGNIHLNREDTISQVELYIINLHYEDVIPHLAATKLWKYRHKMVILGEFSRSNISSIFKHIYEKSHGNSYNVALISLIMTNFTLDGIFINNPFTRDLQKLKQCKMMFPNYVSNMHSHIVNITMKDSFLSTRTSNKFTGPEGLIADSVLEAMNAEGHYFESSDGPTHGGDKPPLTGMIKDVSLGRVDVAFNGRFLTEALHKDMIDKLIEYTYPREREDIVALIPRSVKPHHLTFSRCLIFIYCALGSTLILLGYSKLSRVSVSPVEIFMIGFSVFLSQSVSKPKALRPVVSALYYLAIFIAAWWLTLLASELTFSPNYYPIKSIRDLAFKTSYELKISQRFLIYLKSILERDIFLMLEKRINSTNLDNGFKVINQMKLCLNEGIITKHSVSRYFQDKVLNDNLKPCFNILEEPIIPAWNVFIVSYGSPLLSQVDTLLGRIYESGLDRYFFRCYDLIESSGNRKVGSRFQVISLSFLEPAFNCLFIGEAIASCVFLIELLFVRIINRRM